jgi:hypothetical protein
MKDLTLVNKDLSLKLEHLMVQNSEHQREVIRLSEKNKELTLKNEILQESSRIL